MLADFPGVIEKSKLASTTDNPDEKTWAAKDFWDWLDMLLSTQRDKYAELPAHQKAAKINR